MALDYLLAGSGGDEQKKLQQLWKANNKRFLQLFMQRWAEARQGGRIGNRKFTWVDGVEWLVGGLQAAAQDANAANAGAMEKPFVDKRLAQTAPSFKAPQSTPPLMQGQPLQRGRQSATRWLRTCDVSPSSPMTYGSQGSMGRTSKARSVTNTKPLRHNPLSRRRPACTESPSRLGKRLIPDKTIPGSMPANTGTPDNKADPVASGQTFLAIPVLAQIGKSVSRNAVVADNTAFATGADIENLPEIPPAQ